MGRFDETTAHVDEALRLSPRDTYASTWMHVAATAKFGLGDYEGAVRWEQRAIEANRNDAIAYFQLAAALAALNRPDEAHSAVDAGLKLSPGFSVSRVRAGDERGARSQMAGFRKRYGDAMRKAGVPE